MAFTLSTTSCHFCNIECGYHELTVNGDFYFLDLSCSYTYLIPMLEILCNGSGYVLVNLYQADRTNPTIETRCHLCHEDISRKLLMLYNSPEKRPSNKILKRCSDWLKATMPF